MVTFKTRRCEVLEYRLTLAEGEDPPREEDLALGSALAELQELDEQRLDVDVVWEGPEELEQGSYVVLETET